MKKPNWFKRIFASFKPYVTYVELKDGTVMRWRGYGFAAPEYKLMKGDANSVVKMESRFSDWVQKEELE